MEISRNFLSLPVCGICERHKNELRWSPLFFDVNPKHQKAIRVIRETRLSVARKLLQVYARPGDGFPWVRRRSRGV
jgi:hypothetical protein